MPPELNVLEHFHFLRPTWALLLIPWLAMVVIRSQQRDKQDMFGGIIAPHLLQHLRLQRFDTRWLNPKNFSLLFMVLVLLVIMGPTWRQQLSPLNQDHAALVILLDVSSTMQQKDVQPSRLQRAKQKISDLLALRPDKKSALIVYSGTAHSVLSLTADQDILNQYLAAITPAIMPRSGKFPEYSLPLADEILQGRNAPATIVMFSDGLGAKSGQAFESYFLTHPHQLLVVGVGSEDEEPGIAPLERESLKALATDANGVYLSLTIDDADVRQINQRIESHYTVTQDSALPWFDSGYLLVFPAIGLFLMWFRRGWTLTWMWLILPVVLSSIPAPALAQQETTPITHEQSAAMREFADLWLTRDQQGRLLLQLGRYPQAAARFNDLMWKGIAYYYSEDFMLAAEYFSRQDSDDALFNEANARAQGRDYVRAVSRYDRLLARTPDYPGATANRSQVSAIIDEIDRLSASQQQEAGASTQDKQLSGDDAIPAQGADEISWQQTEVIQLTAEDILQDAATSDMWLRGVQQDPSRFLAIKFGMQLRNAETKTDVPSRNIP
ncbi:VWA domain-containing protein [Halioglobus sp. Uisw_031]|uniref:VWA domain-containing protein n=1 Tax=Halioglobus sp. Uisw_031 TaxID=3230977 RepID=UPI0039E84E0D